MPENIVAICIEGGLVQYVATNNPALKTINVVIIDRDCDIADHNDPTFEPYFEGSPAFIRTDILFLDPKYAEAAHKIATSKESRQL